MDARTRALGPKTATKSAEMTDTTAAGWRADAAADARPSLPEVNSTVRVPFGGHWSRRLLAFVGPGYLVSVGYMDPGNWATDLAGGSKFGYTLLAVILLSNLMAILLQALAARLGIVTDRDLAQACRASFSRPVNFMLWVVCEAAIIACDLAEVIGTAIALNLLFGIPLIWGALITALDAFLLLLLMNKGFRFLEAFVISLLIVIAICFSIQIVAAAPPVAAVLKGFVPSPQIVTNPEMLYIAIGIIGATVMPHNLYLHSSIVQTRAYERTSEGRREAIKWATTDSTIALMLALLASGLNSTVTATLAGQIVMEGFLNLRLPNWARRLVTRGIAIVPVVIVTAIYGERGTSQLLVFSQVILSMQLPFAVIPLVRFVSDKRKMGEFVIPRGVSAIAWLVAGVIVALNVKLLFETFFG
jgi:manganese transport protein